MSAFHAPPAITSPASLCSSPVLDYLQHLHSKYASLKEGITATYIPELANADPDSFGICLVTTEGVVYEVGDSQKPFTIQSISKPFVYGLALEDNTRAEVFTKVGVEPTGEAFNAISLEAGTGRPRNPMINAGAIATTGLVAGRSGITKLQRIIHMMSLYAGRELDLDVDTYKSESDTGHRNRAIGHMLRNFDILTGDPTSVVDLYFKQCSISVTCRDLAIMGATLANRGINPVTKKRAIRGEYVESVLGIMGSCGMYDYAGEWIYRVGMPAKSGVAGGVVAVLPGQFGIAVYSPPLDPRGNSVRGIKVCDDLSRTFDLHLFNSPHASKAVIRLHFTAASVNSSRVRTQTEVRALREHGHRIGVYQLQGNLVFSTAEVIVRTVIEQLDTLRYVIIDFKHTLQVNESACRLLYELLIKLAALDIPLIFTHAEHAPMLRRYIKMKLRNSTNPSMLQILGDNDLALERCENHLLSTLFPPPKEQYTASPTDYELFEDLKPEEIAIISSYLERKHYPYGTTIVHAGDIAKELFILARGHVSVTVSVANGTERRLGTFSPGMAFGEMALLDQCPRSAMVKADTDVECDVLSRETFENLSETHPAIMIRLLANLAHSLSIKLRKANREVSIFDY